jgi:hypothetical protein
MSLSEEDTEFLKGVKREEFIGDSGAQSLTPQEQALAEQIFKNIKKIRQSRGEFTETAGLALAILFHDTYERLAPSFGYETRTETRAFSPDTPNGKLMIAVCTEILNTGIIQA